MEILPFKKFSRDKVRVVKQNCSEYNADKEHDGYQCQVEYLFPDFRFF